MISNYIYIYYMNNEIISKYQCSIKKKKKIYETEQKNKKK